jgi:hypothetical protein
LEAPKPGFPVASILGLSAIIGGTGLYTYEQGFMSFGTPQLASYFVSVAGLYFLVLIAGTVLVVADLLRIVRERLAAVTVKGSASLTPSWLIPYVLSVKRYRRYFMGSAIIYGLFYAVITSMIVYQPTVDFGAAYGATLPSYAIAPCCGGPLSTPVVIVYIVNHLALLLIPMTVLLLVAVSVLVGLNVSLAVFAFDSRARGVGRGWVGGIGAIVGLFTGCPTCAGLFFANMLGGAGAVSFAALLGYYQPVFVLLSLPVLLVAPYLVSRSLAKVFRDGCVYVGWRGA